MAEDNADRNLLVVIPTLDGVQFNLSFLELLAQGGWPVYVRSGWRRPGIMSRNTNDAHRSQALGWLLSVRDEADDFAKMVGRVRRRNLALPGAISAGLQKAVARGARLGSHRRSVHRLTRSEQRAGGRATATKRRLEANEPYREWLDEIRKWRTGGDSIGVIALKLADKGALTTDGRKIGRMLVYRILKREYQP